MFLKRLSKNWGLSSVTKCKRIRMADTWKKAKKMALLALGEQANKEDILRATEHLSIVT